MTTTPPTKQCWRCGGKGWFGYVDKKHKVQRISCPTCYGTGVVAAEADEVVGSDIENDVLTVARGHSNPDGTLTITQIEQTSPAPTAEATKLIPADTELKKFIARQSPSENPANDEVLGGREPRLSPSLNDTTPPAATDDEVMAILDGFARWVYETYPASPRITGIADAPLPPSQALAALEAHYAAKERERVVKMQTELVDPFIDPDFGTVDIKGVGEATMAYIDRLLAERKEGR